MSAPIDDLLYGGDDSGDEDLGASVPMRSFSTPLPLATGLAPLPLASAGLTTAVGSIAATTAAAPSKSLPVAAAATPATASAALRPAPFPHAPAAGQTSAAGTAAAGAAPAKKAPGSGQQMFQQMFALLKQMLPAEQYATLHSEMRKGNGNDIKSIVDIIKRIAGDAIFSSVIQKMDLTRSFPPSAASTNAVKAEPKAAARIPQSSTPLASSSAALGSTVASGAAVAAPPGGATIAAARPLTLPLQVATGAVATAAVPIAAPSALPTSAAATSRFVKPASAAVGSTSASAGSSGTASASASTIKPSGASPMGSRPAMATLAPATATKTSPATAVKPEPSAAVSTPPPPSTGVASAAKGTTASPSSSSPSSTKNEALEKILYAKRLLLHASTCLLDQGVCQFKKCDDVRRVFKHSASCGGANGCTHCEQLKGLVKYHAKECQHSLSEHCAIPFCDGLRRAYMSATAALGSAKSSAAASHALAAAGRGPSVSKGGVLSDDDDDNTPLSSAVSKVKKNTAKSKSPKSSAASKASGAVGSGGNGSKKKGTAAASKAVPAGSANGQVATGAGATGTAAATAAAGSGSPGGGASRGSNAVTANMTLEYGRLLQLILHVQKCTTSTCPVGQECADAKSLLQQINSPNAPARAKTYKQVYAHYKVCLAKNNTSTCPMCKIGLRPILPVAAAGAGAAAGSTASASRPSSASATQSPGSQPASGGKAAAGGAAGGGAATGAPPSGPASLKRTNSMTPSPRSPSKKQRTGGSKAKAGGSDSAGGVGTTSSGSVAADTSGTELVQASVMDIRKEADVLTHTGIDLTAERRTMMGSCASELLPCAKEQWAEADLFELPVLTAHMRAIGRRRGVTLGAHTSDVMAFALREYLKQVMEEMVQVAKQRGDARALSLAQLAGPKSATGGAAGARVELTATDILRVSCEDSFARLRQEDLSLRMTLLEDAKREEAIERERAKKRKKVDRSRLAQEEKDEAEMDVEELATKDLKERLLREDKEGVARVDGRVNESISARLTPSRDTSQVTMEDAGFWLQSQKPYVQPKLFARAEVARVVTKALH